ncbi:MAG: hypothetical protein RLN99_08680, partial [Kiloniellaceae bacterium]
MTKAPKRSSAGRLRSRSALKDPSAGGKRSAMGMEEDPAAPFIAEGEDVDLSGLGEGLARGVTVIADTVKTLSSSPGVYR